MTLARRHEITRLEAFSDTVFAFALTRLVVSLEAFDARLYAGRHALSAMVGLLSIGWALGRLVPFAGFVYFLMAPVQTGYGAWSGRRRRGFETPPWVHHA